MVPGCKCRGAALACTDRDFAQSLLFVDLVVLPKWFQHIGKSRRFHIGSALDRASLGSRPCLPSLTFYIFRYQGIICSSLPGWSSTRVDLDTNPSGLDNIQWICLIDIVY